MAPRQPYVNQKLDFCPQMSEIVIFIEFRSVSPSRWSAPSWWLKPSQKSFAMNQSSQFWSVANQETQFDATHVFKGCSMSIVNHQNKQVETSNQDMEVSINAGTPSHHPYVCRIFPYKHIYKPSILGYPD